MDGTDFERGTTGLQALRPKGPVAVFEVCTHEFSHSTPYAT
jgi:hypothetical protein